ncbi:BTAD domain-containing putative transcriptional regulator [Pelagibius sp.]|uniref:AfsR/SARP family transcriptional regulator n=1 Tax=Pelagibius sp. TaxID=1931238 RepID=UPI00262414B5|nr:BTAD domain-containing putative transcriptional regulator [Pelagibius sp.]
MLSTAADDAMGMQPMTQLTVSLFGSLQVSHQPSGISFGGRPGRSPATHPTGKVARLLAYLLLGGRQSHQRDELAECFWGDRDSNSARRCLSTAVWRLRQIVEPAGTPSGTYLLSNAGDEIAFNWESDHRVDCLEFEVRIDSALRIRPESMTHEAARALEECLGLYRGELLCGVYDSWALRERERLRSRYLDGLTLLMRHWLHVGNYRGGIEVGERILGQDPLREDVHRDMMRLFAGAGDRSRAIRQYQECCRLLSRELRVEPLEETRALHDSISTAGHCETLVHPRAQQISAGEALAKLRSALEEVERARAVVEQVLPGLEPGKEPPLRGNR